MSEKLWQHPFVNVLKYVKSDHDFELKKSGDVKETMDKVCGKTVFEIRGSVAANNFVQIPQNQSKVIGLTGNFIYIQLHLLPTQSENESKKSTENFMFHIEVVTKDDLVLRLSFGNVFNAKKVNSYSLFTPLIDISQRWTVLAIDLGKIVTEHFKRTFKATKSFTFCSSVVLKNIYTSDLIYDSSCLPRDMYLPIPKGKTWNSLYDWIWHPSCPASSLSEKTYHTPYSTHPIQNISPAPPISARDAPSFISKSSEKVVEKKALHPDPILRINRVIGVSSNMFSHIKWSADGESLIYPCFKQIVIMNVKTKEQNLLFGHTAKVSSISLDIKSKYIVSAQEGRTPLLRVWNIISKSCIGILKGPDSDVNCVAISDSGNMVVAVGKDAGAKVKLVVWDISELESTGRAHIVAKHSCDFHTAKVLFVPFDDGKFITCGKENVRFWRIKRGNLKGCSLTAENSTLLRQNFIDLSFEKAFVGSYLENDHRVFTTTQSGAIFQISYRNRQIECVCQLHNGAIRTVDINEGMCITGSDDKFLRVWPLDFSDYFIEAEHDCKVVSTTISKDGLTVCIGIENGTIGMLDLTNQKYSTMIRSHSSTVHDVAIDLKHGTFSSVSSDMTIRVWDLLSFEQQVQFDAMGECPLCVAYHPEKSIIACGFDSGMIRLFDVQNTTLIEQFKAHSKPVGSLLFTTDSRWLISAAADSLCVIDCEHFYQPVKVVHYLSPSECVCLDLSLDGKLVASVGPAGNILHIFDTKNFDEQFTFDTGASDSFIDIVFAADSKSIYAITTENRLLKFSLKSKTIAAELITTSLTTKKATCIHRSTNKKYVIVGFDDGLIQIWDSRLQKNSKCQTFLGHSGSISKALFTDDSHTIISCGVDCIITWKFLGTTEPDLSLIIDNKVSIAETKMQKHILNESDEELDSDRKPFAVSTVIMDPLVKRTSLNLYQIVSFKSTHQNLNWSTNKIIYSAGKFLIQEAPDRTSQRYIYVPLGEIELVHVDPDKTVIAASTITSASEPASIILWNYSTLEQISSLVFHYHRVQYLAFSYTEDLLVSLGSETEKSVVVWSTSTGKIIYSATTAVHQTQIIWFPKHLQSSDQQELVSIGEEIVIFWLLDKNGQLLMQEIAVEIMNAIKSSLSCEKLIFTHVSFSTNPSDCTLWLATDQGAVIGYDVHNNSINYCWKTAHNEPITVIVAKEDYLVSCSESIVNQWKWNFKYDLQGKSQHKFSLDSNFVLDGAVSCVVTEFDDALVSTDNNSLFYLNWRNKTNARLLSAHNGLISSICSSDIEDVIISSSEDDGVIKFWKRKTKNHLYESNNQIISLDNENKTLKVPSMMLSHSCVFLYYGQENGNLCLVDLGKMQQRFQKPIFSNSSVVFMELTKDDKTALLIASNNQIALVELPSGQVLERIDSYHNRNDKIVYASIAPNYSSVECMRWALFTENGSIEVWEFTQGNSSSVPISRYKEKVASIGKGVFVGRFSPHHEQKACIIGLANSHLFAYDTMEQKKLATLDLSEYGELTCVTISPQCDFIAIGNQIGQVIMMPYGFMHQQSFTQIEKEIKVYQSSSSQIVKLEFSEVGSKLIAGSKTGEITIFTVNH